MFGPESYLRGLYRLSHGNRQIGQQIAYWYTTHLTIHSMSIRKQLDIVHHGHFMDGYIDDLTIKKYKEHFDYSFFQKFFCLPDESVIYRSRYKIGLAVYHSLIYSFRKQSSSYKVCANNCDCSKKLCYGEIVFFFSHRNNMFLFLFSHPSSISHTFSSSIQVDKRIPMWSKPVDSFYSLVYMDVANFSIFHCSTVF